MGTGAQRILAATALFAATMGSVAVATPAGAATASTAPVHATVVKQPDNTFACSAWGYGATLAAAKEQAREMWVGNRVIGYPSTAQGQYPDGTWWYEIYGDCYIQM